MLISILNPFTGRAYSYYAIPDYILPEEFIEYEKQFDSTVKKFVGMLSFVGQVICCTTRSTIF
jgi:hypothetical protein